MSPLALLLLRRATIYALVLAVLLVVGPKLLTAFGILGPSLEEEIESVERSLLAARSYGASEAEPTHARAAQALARARAAASRRERWQAKRALGEARESAIDAQRAALAAREESRQAAHKVIGEVDRALNELEDLFGEVRKRVDKKESDRLFSLMKATRQKSAALFLLFEEQSYAKVVAGDKEVREILASTRQQLLEARAGRRAGS
jgi:hypothetical protein